MFLRIKYDFFLQRMQPKLTYEETVYLVFVQIEYSSEYRISIVILNYCDMLDEDAKKPLKFAFKKILTIIRVRILSKPLLISNQCC